MPDVDPTTRHVVTKQHRVGPKQGCAIVVTGDSSGVQFERFVDGVGAFANFPISSGTMYVVATFDGAMLRLYVDGLLADTTADARPVVAISDPAYIASSSPTESQFYRGVIDEVTIYDHALSDARVAEHYRVGTH